MTRLKRDNREIVVRDEQVTAYLKQGYAVIDARGNVIAEGRAMDYGSAMQRIAELEARNAGLAASLEQARARIAELEAPPPVKKTTKKQG